MHGDGNLLPVNSSNPSPERKAREEEAFRWWTRIDAGALSPEESRAFAAWLTQHPGNKAAFDEASRLWGELETLRPYLAGTAAPAPAPRLSWRMRAAAIAALLLALFLSADEIVLRLRATERTGVGETRIVSLEDGSRVQLNVNSAIAVDFDSGARRLSLLRGEAWFEVAPDASRPFSVAAGGGVITALGTIFDVTTERARTEVTVAEHRVLITGNGPNVIVEAGRQSAFGPGLAAAASYPVDVDQVTAWRRGKLIFEDRPLREVVAALGQYHHGYFLIVDPGVRERRVTGVFNASDPIGAIRVIERSLGLKVTYVTRFLVVLRG